MTPSTIRLLFAALILSSAGCSTTGSTQGQVDHLNVSYAGAVEFEKEAFPRNQALLHAKFPSIYEEGQRFWEDYRILEKRVGKSRAREILERAVSENGFSVYFLFPGCHDLFTHADLKEIYTQSGSRATEVMKALVGDPVDWQKVEKIRNDRVRPM